MPMQVQVGWCLGREEFRQELLAAAVERVGASHYGADRRETGEQKAERIVREELKRRGWKEQDLPGLSKGDKDKVALARRLRQETTMSLKWIARRLRMGSWTYVSNLLHENDDAKFVSIVRTDTWITWMTPGHLDAFKGHSGLTLSLSGPFTKILKPLFNYISNGKTRLGMPWNIKLLG
jgi:hypothetical protein